VGKSEEKVVGEVVYVANDGDGIGGDYLLRQKWKYPANAEALVHR
jgi:hypothetical protein